MDLVVYYSRTNKTRMVARTIKKEKNAKIVEIEDKKERKGIFNYAVSAVESVFGKKTEINYEYVNLKDFDVVYLGSPVWASKPTPAIIKFIDENDFNGVDVITFATMSSSGGESTTNHMNKLIKAKGGNILRSFAITTKNDNIIELTKKALN